MKYLLKPHWLKKQLPPPPDLVRVKSIPNETTLLVCEEARCLDLEELFGAEPYRDENFYSILELDTCGKENNTCQKRILRRNRKVI